MNKEWLAVGRVKWCHASLMPVETDMNQPIESVCWVPNNSTPWFGGYLALVWLATSVEGSPHSIEFSLHWSRLSTILSNCTAVAWSAHWIFCWAQLLGFQDTHPSHESLESTTQLSSEILGSIRRLNNIRCFHMPLDLTMDVINGQWRELRHRTTLWRHKACWIINSHTACWRI